nr:unnamed protein product [Spirometra erinaceieuropaei]
MPPGNGIFTTIEAHAVSSPFALQDLMAKWLFRRLKFLTADSDTIVCSSTQFLEKLKGDLAIETVELLLRSKYNETENRLGHARVLQLVKFCLRTYFAFDETIYEQVKGTPMGSPISGFIVGAVLQRLESLVFQHHRPRFWTRYAEDTFGVIERDQLLMFKERLNSVFPDIQCVTYLMKCWLKF